MHHDIWDWDLPAAPTLIDVPHWAAEWTWLPRAEAALHAAASDAGVRLASTVSHIVTDPWVARFG